MRLNKSLVLSINRLSKRNTIWLCSACVGLSNTKADIRESGNFQIKISLSEKTIILFERLWGCAHRNYQHFSVKLNSYEYIKKQENEDKRYEQMKWFE